jgi:hypothetical protein
MIKPNTSAYYKDLFDSGKYHQILGIPSGSSPLQARKAYILLSKSFHPDVSERSGIPKAEAQRIFGYMNSAYAILSGRSKEAMLNDKVVTEKMRKQDLGIHILLQKYAPVKTQLHRILQSDLQRSLEMQMQLEKRTRLFGQVENGVYKVWMWVKDRKGYRRLIYLSSALMAAIVTGAYVWNRQRQAFVKKPISGYLSYTNKVKRR